MRIVSRPLVVLRVTVALVALILQPARAVVVLSTGDPSHNTNAPAGSLAGSGWEYQGQFAGFLGTVIAPTFFIAAKHIGGDTNMDFVLNQQSYKTVRYFDCPNADLRIFQVDQTFAHYAPLYTNSNEAGRHCVVFGRGTERGNPIIINHSTNGWGWGAPTRIQRWGENDVQSIVTDPQLGDFLYCTFDRTGGSNECMLTDGDSSGGVFIQDGTQWKLAGLNSGVDGPFSTDGTTNTLFAAAFLNMKGFYILEGTQWQYIATQTPSGFYSTRISAHLDWIRSIINFAPGDDFRFTGIQRSGDDLAITLLTAPGREYRIDYTTNLTQPAWNEVTTVTATNASTTVVDPKAATVSGSRYYRLVLLD